MAQDKKTIEQQIEEIADIHRNIKLESDESIEQFHRLYKIAYNALATLQQIENKVY